MFCLCQCVTLSLGPAQLRVLAGSHLSPLHENFWSLHLDGPSWAARDPELHARLLAKFIRAGGTAAQFAENVDTAGRKSAGPHNTFGLAPADIPATALETSPGDVAFFSHQCWHGSFGGAPGRRMFTLNFKCRAPHQSPPRDYAWADMPLGKL